MNKALKLWNELEELLNNHLYDQDIKDQVFDVCYDTILNNNYCIEIYSGERKDLEDLRNMMSVGIGESVVDMFFEDGKLIIHRKRWTS